MNGLIATRLATAEDGPFLFTVYAGARQEEVAAFGWPAAQQEAFLRMQFQIRTRAYGTAWPDAESRIILQGDRPVGSLLVHRGAKAIHLVDIALLPEARGAGTGSRLIRDLQAEAAAAGKAVTLSVLTENHQARRLYERLGFTQTESQPPYIGMQWLPSAGGATET
jgi:ribosomal protein S18 acetylase RimI-like enzyme